MKGGMTGPEGPGALGKEGTGPRGRGRAQSEQPGRSPPGAERT